MGIQNQVDFCLKATMFTVKFDIYILIFEIPYKGFQKLSFPNPVLLQENQNLVIVAISASLHFRNYPNFI